MNTNQEMLYRNHNELIELQHVLQKDDEFFSEVESARGHAGFVNGNVALSTMIKYVTGTIDQEKFNTFERVLFRATRGNLYLRYSEIEAKIRDPHTGDIKKKHVFVIFFQGEELQTKIKKLCESFGANIYPCPDTAKERHDLLQQVQARLDDLNVVLVRTLQHRRQVLATIANQLDMWKAKVKKEKAIYHTINMFDYDVGRQCLVAEGWCPVNSLEDIQLALRRGRERSGAIIPSILNKVKPAKDEAPPTYFRTNKFTEAFQNIVDAYGVARYREINPGMTSIIFILFYLQS